MTRSGSLRRSSRDSVKTVLLLACLELGCTARTSRSHGAADGAAPDAAFRSGYASVNGLRMYYEVHGVGRPLLLLHGGGSSIRTTFGKVLPLLVRQRQVIAVEQQAHGRTADIDRALSFEQMADDTALLLRQLRVEKADVFGFSNGGNVALQLAVRHPAQVRRLVVGSAFYANRGLQPHIREMFRRPATPAAMPPPLREEYLRIAPRPDDLPNQVAKIMAMLSSFQDWPEDMLRTIAAPALVLQGNSDVATTGHAAEMCQLIPTCELVVLPGGHGTYLGEATAARAGSSLPSVTVALVEEFLDNP